MRHSLRCGTLPGFGTLAARSGAVSCIWVSVRSSHSCQQLSAAVSRIQILFTASWEFAVAYLAAASRWQWRCVGWGEGLAAGQRARSQGMVPGRWLS